MGLGVFSICSFFALATSLLGAKGNRVSRLKRDPVLIEWPPTTRAMTMVYGLSTTLLLFSSYALVIGGVLYEDAAEDPHVVEAICRAPEKDLVEVWYGLPDATRKILAGNNSFGEACLVSTRVGALGLISRFFGYQATNALQSVRSDTWLDDAIAVETVVVPIVIGFLLNGFRQRRTIGKEFYERAVRDASELKLLTGRTSKDSVQSQRDALEAGIMTSFSSANRLLTAGGSRQSAERAIAVVHKAYELGVDLCDEDLTALCLRAEGNLLVDILLLGWHDLCRSYTQWIGELTRRGVTSYTHPKKRERVQNELKSLVNPRDGGYHSVPKSVTMSPFEAGKKLLSIACSWMHR